MKRIILASLLAANVHASTCNVNDVTINGVSALSCTGMHDGNVNSVNDVNAVLNSNYTNFAPLSIENNTFSLTGSGFVEIVLKQNTHWATYSFDLSQFNGPLNGIWSTSGMHWDNQPDVRGCQGCGELSHAGIAISEVPIPPTLALLGIGLLGLGLVKRHV